MFERPVTDVPLRERYDAAVAVGMSGDRRFGDWRNGWIAFGQADYISGASREGDGANLDADAAPWEAPTRQRHVPEFWLRRHPVVVQEFLAFIDGLGYDRPEFWSDGGWSWKRSLGVREPLDLAEQRRIPNAPITGVSWYEAEAFANWLSSFADGGTYAYGLPSEWEWEYAARHDVPVGYQFPWGRRMKQGDEAEGNWAGAFLRRKTPPGLFPQSTTAAGLADLYGNVEEWCREVWLSSSPNWSTGHAAEARMHVVRGGSCIRFARLCRPTYRSRIAAEGRYHTVGFRLARYRRP